MRVMLLLGLTCDHYHPNGAKVIPEYRYYTTREDLLTWLTEKGNLLADAADTIPIEMRSTPEGDLSGSPVN